MVKIKSHAMSISSSIREKVENGILFAPAPKGYLKTFDPLTSEQIISIDPIWADAVSKLFKLYSSGKYTIIRICKIINKENNVHLATTTAYRILKNPFYIGFLKSGEELFKHTYPLFLDKELFDTVQKNLLNLHNTRKRHATSFLFQKLIVCGYCNSRIICGKQRTQRYYNCKCVTSQYITEADLETLFYRIFDEMNPEIKPFFEELDLPNKKHVIKYLFRRITLKESDLTYIFSDRLNTVSHLKYYLQNGIQSMEKTVSLRKDITYDNIYLDSCKKPKSTEEIMNFTNLSLDEVQSALLDLQLEGKIDQNDRGLWQTII